jgi:hypothetical protein
MSAGTGILHSEFNPSETEPVHLYQIWLLPRQKGIAPSYEQRAFPDAEKHGRLRVVASPDGRDGSLTIGQDASVYLSSLDAKQQVAHELPPGRHAWLQVLRGAVELNGSVLVAGDGVGVSEEQAVAMRAKEPSEVMLFDLN